jgi:hypothetical protein
MEFAQPLPGDRRRSATSPPPPLTPQRRSPSLDVEHILFPSVEDPDRTPTQDPKKRKKTFTFTFNRVDFSKPAPSDTFARRSAIVRARSASFSTKLEDSPPTPQALAKREWSSTRASRRIRPGLRKREGPLLEYYFVRTLRHDFVTHTKHCASMVRFTVLFLAHLHHYLPVLFLTKAHNVAYGPLSTTTGSRTFDAPTPNRAADVSDHIAGADNHTGAVAASLLDNTAFVSQSTPPEGFDPGTVVEKFMEEYVAIEVPGTPPSPSPAPVAARVPRSPRRSPLLDGSSARLPGCSMGEGGKTRYRGFYNQSVSCHIAVGKRGRTAGYRLASGTPQQRTNSRSLKSHLEQKLFCILISISITTRWP